jgi:tellurite resistance protein TerC
MDMFTYLKVGLSLVLCFVGAKMVIVDIYKIPTGVSLGIVGGILLLAIIASMLKQRKSGDTVVAPPMSGTPEGDKPE